VLEIAQITKTRHDPRARYTDDVVEVVGNPLVDAGRFEARQVDRGCSPASQLADIRNVEVERRLSRDATDIWHVNSHPAAGADAELLPGDRWLFLFLLVLGGDVDRRSGFGLGPEGFGGTADDAFEAFPSVTEDV
jgi:hypothetical protein